MPRNRNSGRALYPIFRKRENVLCAPVRCGRRDVGNGRPGVPGGARFVDYRVVSDEGDYRVDTVTPSAALVLRPSAKSSLYASYLQGLESAGVAPDDAENAGEVLAPARSKQWEVGARLEILGACAALSWFHIDQALAYTDAANYYVVNGRALYRGFEASLQGNLAKNVSLALSGQRLVSEQAKTGSDELDGNEVVNAPRWSGSAFAVNGGACYTGARFSDDENLARLPGYVPFSLGANYRWEMPSGQVVTLRINGDNIFNKRC
ncbi:TonB-dependent receptor [Novosphingobium profundi]|uniref:TonB-dependent receptor domain-containing protein n=1 Tax=Novosphingobium profundi TaxID=1774954 RepID=UPI001BDA7E2A|nr:TonB-dependent receptor [Novosphingobium profundi]MBT0670328.1 TonB-dependent receptor [Novosphingobium profundi]